MDGLVSWRQMGRRRKHNKRYPQHLQLKSGRFYFHVRLNGKYRWIPLRTSDEGEALKRWAEVETALRQEKDFKLADLEKDGRKRIVFSAFVEEYFRDVAVDLSDGTQSDYKRMSKELIKKFGDYSLHNIKRPMIIKYHKSLRKTPYEANRRIALIRTMLQYALDLDYITINPADHIKKFKEEKFELQLTTDILFKQIYPVADPMLKRAIMLGFHFAQHEMEVKNFQLTNFNFEKKFVDFIRRKTGERIVINYSGNATLCAYLDYLRANRKELCPFLTCRPTKQGWKPFSSFRSMWNRALKNAGYEEGAFKFKELRHLANTCMKDANIPADKRKSVTGHESIASNEIYTHKTGQDTIDAEKALGIFTPDRF